MSNKNRLLLELEHSMRSINQEVINPEIPELTIVKLRPVLEMVARARAVYLKALFDMANENHGALPSAEQTARLCELRTTYDECAAGAKAMDTAIQRGYLDVHGQAG